VRLYVVGGFAGSCGYGLTRLERHLRQLLFHPATPQNMIQIAFSDLSTSTSSLSDLKPQDLLVSYQKHSEVLKLEPTR
jgi:hypothetical protein